MISSAIAPRPIEIASSWATTTLPSRSRIGSFSASLASSASISASPAPPSTLAPAVELTAVRGKTARRPTASMGRDVVDRDRSLVSHGRLVAERGRSQPGLLRGDAALRGDRGVQVVEAEVPLVPPDVPAHVDDVVVDRRGVDDRVGDVEGPLLVDRLVMPDDLEVPADLADDPEGAGAVERTVDRVPAGAITLAVLADGDVRHPVVALQREAAEGAAEAAAEVERQVLGDLEAAVPLQLDLDVGAGDVVVPLRLVPGDLEEPPDDHGNDRRDGERPEDASQGEPHRAGVGARSTAGALAASPPVVKNSRGPNPKPRATIEEGKTAIAVFSVSTVSL